MQKSTNMKKGHSWRFFRAGGFDQVRLDSGADLLALDQLDQKLWVALSCPTRGLEFDSKTLDLIDTDKDGHVHPSEIIAAVKWAGNCLKNPDDLLKCSPSLPLSAINDATPEGRQLVASARQILTNLGRKETDAITVEDTMDLTRIFAQTQFNGDGIIPVDAAADDATKAVITDIMACLGSDTDRSGKPGISQARVDQFFTEAQACSDWWKQAEGDTNIMPLGEATATAATAVKAVKIKVDDYFARCRLAAFDPRALAAINREEKEYLALAAKDLTVTSAEIAGFPLARVEAGKPLPLKEGINPAWADALGRFQVQVVTPLLGNRISLTELEWIGITAKFGPYECWSAGKAGAVVEKLGLRRVREILSGKNRENLTALVAKDKALEPEANAISAVEKLVRYHRDLYELLVNFVNFRDFYSRKAKAIFQAGTLYLDQRSCDLCLTVEDTGKHAAMAGLAGSYLAYCDCVRKSSSEKMQIVAAFTDGDSDNLMVGRNGLFYDRKGRDWNATITKIIDNPISIRQAFWAPYKKFVRMIEEQIAKRAAEAETATTTQLQTTATTTVNVDKSKTAQPRKIDIGVVAALGVAFGAIGTALSALATGLMKLPTWQIPLVFVGLALLISGPSMLIAWLKLRKRNLGPILDANGWAVNSKARINVPFGGSLTQVASLPPGSQRDLIDPYAEKKSPWPAILVVVVIFYAAYSLLDREGLIYEWTQGWLGKPASVQVEKAKDATAAPATKPPAEPPK